MQAKDFIFDLYSKFKGELKLGARCLKYFSNKQKVLKDVEQEKANQWRVTMRTWSLDFITDLFHSGDLISDANKEEIFEIENTVDPEFIYYRNMGVTT